MPQRVNAKSDIGNSKLASDVYDTNNIFLSDQGWIYRHWKGDPSDADVRYWDEILVAGQVDPDYPQGGDSSPIEITEYSTESSAGSLKYENPTKEAGYEPNQALSGDPDGVFDVEYGIDPTNYDFDALRDADGNVLPPPLPQFPAVAGYETPGFTGSYPVTTDQPTGATAPVAQAIDGYYPLYTTEAAANGAGDGTHHTHTFNGTTYYMPNGVTFYHGDYTV